MKLKQTGVTLRKGATISLFCDNDSFKTIQTDVELDFDLDDLNFDERIRQFYYKKPQPIHEGTSVFCIEWNINRENELPIYG